MMHGPINIRYFLNQEYLTVTAIPFHLTGGPKQQQRKFNVFVYVIFPQVPFTLPASEKLPT